jgi:hypothetical protein
VTNVGMSVLIQKTQKRLIKLETSIERTNSNMKMIKPSINVKYIIEWCDNDVWEALRSFTLLDKAEEYLQLQKECAPNSKFRLVRSEWQVIG